MYPEAKVRPDVLYCHDGNILTGAGSAAGIDASLHLMRDLYGARVAATVARRIVVPPHRDGGQAQFIERAVPDCDTETFGPLLEWILGNLDEDLDVATLARKSLMSPRTFARRFRAETGATPHSWVTQQRVLRAEQLLEETDRSVEWIADEVGFGNAAALRHHFTRVPRRQPAAVPADLLPDPPRPPRTSSRAPSRAAYRPPSATSSSCEPSSTTRPWSRTAIWSASRIVESRCAMVIVVRPRAAASRAAWTCALGAVVQRAGGLVEDQHRGVAEQGAGDGQPLLLAAGEPVPTGADDGVVAVGQAGDHVVDPGGPAGVLDLGVGRARGGRAGGCRGPRRAAGRCPG